MQLLAIVFVLVVCAMVVGFSIAAWQTCRSCCLRVNSHGVVVEYQTFYENPQGGSATVPRNSAA